MFHARLNEFIQAGKSAAVQRNDIIINQNINVAFVTSLREIIIKSVFFRQPQIPISVRGKLIYLT